MSIFAFISTLYTVFKKEWFLSLTAGDKYSLTLTINKQWFVLNIMGVLNSKTNYCILNSNKKMIIALWLMLPDLTFLFSNLKALTFLKQFEFFFKQSLMFIQISSFGFFSPQYRIFLPNSGPNAASWVYHLIDKSSLLSLTV